MPTKYTPTEVDKALTTLAYCGGNAVRAGKLTGIPETTLKEWRRETHRDRYQEIAERERPRLEALAVDQAVSTIIRAGELEHGIMDRLADAVNDDETKAKELTELAGALQRVTTSKGINGTKLLELTGRPTQITEHRSATDTLRSLAQRFPGLVIDGTAEEVTNEEGPPKRALGPARLNES